MKLTLRDKVIAKMIKNGNNPEQVELMVGKHFTYASGKYKGVSKIADVIRTIYQKMTQEELQQKVLTQIKALGTIRAFNQCETLNPFKGVVNRKDAYLIARGMFEKVSKKQIDALEYYFLKLEKTNEDVQSN